MITRNLFPDLSNTKCQLRVVWGNSDEHTTLLTFFNDRFHKNTYVKNVDMK